MDAEIPCLVNCDEMRPIGVCRQILFGDEPTVEPPNVASPVDLSSTHYGHIIAEVYRNEVFVTIVRSCAGSPGPVFYSVAGNQLSLYLYDDVPAVVDLDGQRVKSMVGDDHSSCISGR